MLAVGVGVVLGVGADRAVGQPPAGEVADPVAELVGRLDLERYKATLKGLTQFGDRRQGTRRNRDAVDWIEAWLEEAGCTTTERLHYSYYETPAAPPPAADHAPGPRRP